MLRKFCIYETCWILRNVYIESIFANFYGEKKNYAWCLYYTYELWFDFKVDLKFEFLEIIIIFEICYLLANLVLFAGIIYY